MSTLSDLMRDLCPDGVLRVTLGDVARYSQDRITVESVDETTYTGVENLIKNCGGRVDAASVPAAGSVTGVRPGDILIGNIRPYFRKIWLADRFGGASGDVLCIRTNDPSMLLPRFLYHVLSSDAFFVYAAQHSKGAKMPRGDKTAIMQYSVPVPPLPVQSELVRMLDAFVGLIANLEIELDLRRKQFEHYRHKLLTLTPPPQ